MTGNDRVLSLYKNTAISPSTPQSADQLETILSKLRFGSLTIRHPDGLVRTFQGSEPGVHANWNIHDWRAVDLVLRQGDVGLGEAYLEGWWSSSDPAALITLAALNRQAIKKAVYGQLLGLLGHMLSDRLRTNTRRISPKNIHQHYDRPTTDFFRIWLDSTMTYSAGLFEGDNHRSLRDAQIAKHRDVIQQLGIRDGDRVLDIGCGWGGFLFQALRFSNARIFGITLSERQNSYVQSILAAYPSFRKRAQVSLADYRTIHGIYDHMVSMEMFEHVGRKYWRTYFRTLRKHLKPGGKLFLQTTVIAEKLEHSYTRSTDFIRRYVFPGGHLPSVRSLTEAARREGFSLRPVRSMREDYIETLRRWRKSLLTFHDSVLALGYDERQIRLWDITFAYSQGAFQSGSTNVWQFILQ